MITPLNVVISSTYWCNSFTVKSLRKTIMHNVKFATLLPQNQMIKIRLIININKNDTRISVLTHYSSVLLFYTPWKHHKRQKYGKLQSHALVIKVCELILNEKGNLIICEKIDERVVRALDYRYRYRCSTFPGGSTVNSSLKSFMTEVPVV